MLLTIPASVRLEKVLANYNKKGRVTHTCFVCQQDTANGDANNLNYYKLGTKKVCTSCITDLLRHPSLKDYEYLHSAQIDENVFYKKVLDILKDEQYLKDVRGEK